MSDRVTTAVGRKGWYVWVGLACVLGGPFLYIALLDPAFMRSGLTAFVPMAVGLVLSLYACSHDRRLRIILSAMVNVALVALFCVAFFVLTRVPTDPTFASLDQAPDFTLMDHRGETVNLRDTLTRGPVLLVTYRGHW